MRSTDGRFRQPDRHHRAGRRGLCGDFVAVPLGQQLGLGVVDNDPAKIASVKGYSVDPWMAALVQAACDVEVEERALLYWERVPSSSNNVLRLASLAGLKRVEFTLADTVRTLILTEIVAIFRCVNAVPAEVMKISGCAEWRPPRREVVFA